LFEIDDTGSCDDKVVLTDGDGIAIGTYCPYDKPDNIDGSTSSNKLTVVFYSNEDTPAGGFEMVYWLILDGM
jgi:hypothetical protein